MKGTVLSVSDWISHAPPKTRLYHLTVELEDGRNITFFKDLANSPPENLWEGEEVEVVWRKHKEDDLVLPFII